jgi:hypothetical protein
MVKTKFKIEIIQLRLIILIFLHFSGDVAMIGQLRWIAHMSRELVEADLFT